MIRLHRLVATIALLSAPSVFATGEKIALVPESNPLRDTLCISMDCVRPGEQADVIVAAHPVKTGMEISVTAGGQRRLTQVASASAEGQISSTDLVKLTSAVLKAIEQPAGAPLAESGKPAAAPVKTAVRAKPRPHLKLVARR